MQQERRILPVKRGICCDKCGKAIDTQKYSLEEYVYKHIVRGKMKYYCSYNHMRVAQLEDEAQKQAKKSAQRKEGKSND